jgi:hypothetical protein
MDSGFPMLDRAVNSHISRISLQFLAILAMPLLMAKTESGIRLPKWLSYAAYPGHLLILWLIKLLVQG